MFGQRSVEEDGRLMPEFADVEEREFIGLFLSFYTIIFGIHGFFNLIF